MNVPHIRSNALAYKTRETTNLGLYFLIFLFFPGSLQAIAAQSPKLREIKFPADLPLESPISADFVSEGWIALFDGHSLFGWRMESDANWRVEDGQIAVDRGKPGLLRTASQFDHFELIVEYACDDKTDSGIVVRTSPKPGPEDAFEIKIAGPDDAESTGSLVDLQDSQNVNPEKSEFNRIHITVEKEMIKVSLNGTMINQYHDAESPVRGYIGLQFSKGKIRFRNIWLRPLLLRPLHGDTELPGWKTDDGNLIRASNNENHDLVLQGGPGYVESSEQFGNFLLQLKCNISAGGNSGVFYRCIPGENTNGYEAQIDNGKIENDWTRPANCGTGGIFRRKDARQIMAVDNAWFVKTIVAEGPHVGVWVNGYQVTDWTDKRKPDPNPRRGLRTDAGTLMLQGHDDNTTVRFREIQVREMSDRR